MYTSVLLLTSTVVCTSAFLDSLIWREFNPQNCSSTTDYQCLNNRCVSNKVRCDGSNDCGDFSDEQDCDLFLCRETKFFKCKNQRCISKSFLCDGENDCDDFSDEVDCDDFKLEHVALNTTCAKGEWQCTDKLCIPEDWVCNQEMDCLDGSDEGVGCTIKDIECDGFRCLNNRCVPDEWRCNGHDDCSDNSDELDCEHHFDPKECTLDNQKFLCKDGKACVDLHKVCNGRNDCTDKSDEGGFCTSSLQTCSNKQCPHTCVMLPTGPKCLCPAGFVSKFDNQCEDVNECEEYGLCDQRCRNTAGSYECSCEHKYVLQEDGKTCKAIGGEATMIYSSKSQIRSYLLNSDLLFPIADNLKQVVGVSSDGHHIYWTDVHSEHESIVRALEDGSDRQLIVTSGLGLPEDLEVDYLTGNIYFSDVQKQQIGVCKNDGSHCTVLINADIRKPRGIALDVDQGNMYWTDWGTPSEIAFALMDGSKARSFLRDDIHWPNGLALDSPNSRLYWTDAKKMSLESIRLDGTDRRVVLKGVAKHPFAISVFENKLYWSDWGTHSIDSCDKFTGKDHKTLIKESKDYIYGISIFHSALHQRLENPCAVAFCSDICLLSGMSYTCACSDGRQLTSDKHTCQSIEKKQMLALATKDQLFVVEHKTLGKHLVTVLPPAVKDAGAVTYNSRNHSLLVSDLANGRIVEFNLHTHLTRVLPVNRIDKVISMDYDPTGNNLYLCDHHKNTLEVINLNTMSSKVLIHDADNEVPISVAVVPHEGIMFVSFYDETNDKSHIDRMSMDGTGRMHVIENSLTGPVVLHYDAHYQRLFFVDTSTGDIEHTNVDGDERHLFKSLRTTIADVTTLNTDLFWTNQFSRRLYWADKSTADNVQKITMDISVDVVKMHVTSITPNVQVDSVCQYNNGNCSHLCLASHKTVVCACPSRMSLDSDNRRCVHQQECDTHEFKCTLSNTCILDTLKCNGKQDCPMGEDEDNCKKDTHCSIGYFGCGSGECISENQVCDHNYDCKDKSDEHQCHLKGKKCHPMQHQCGDGSCINDRFLCDGTADCSDQSDEHNCLSNTCASSQFRCDSGMCIPQFWECDEEYDCDDLSDEHSECLSSTCPEEMFTCSNGKCIDHSLVCDKSNDCGDLSDESSCLLTCPNQLQCANSSVCLPPLAKCNGTKDCPMGDDEEDCSNCGSDSFECVNKKCIAELWVCDGTDDCGDGSDENVTVCQHKQVTSRFSHTQCEDGFRCKSGACISLSLLCNGKHDCFDESDEGGLCSKSCMDNPCSQECIRTPSGAMCRCKFGYKLMGDGHTCKDIDECSLDPPACAQLCHNTDGGYTCDCYQGYSLRSDRKSCKSTGQPLSMLYTIKNQIREIAQKSNSLKILYSEETPKITDLDVAVKERALVFTIENSATIQRLNVDTLKRDYIEHIGYPSKTAYDWSTGNIYYYNAQSNDKSISVCSFTSMACSKLINVDQHRHVSELAVDSENRVLFYTLTSWWVFNAPSYVLYRANLDGGNVTEVVKSSDGYISGLTYDLNKKMLYYADQHHGHIVGTTYEGKQWRVLFNFTYPSGLKFFEDTLYVSTNNGDMSRCHLYAPRTCATFQISAHNYDLFALSQDSLQPTVPDVCQTNKCQFMCVAGATGYKCLCEDGSIVDETIGCTDKQRSASVRVKFHSVDGKVEEEGGSNKTVVSVILVSVTFMLIGVGLIVYVRRRHGSQLNFGMRFYNNPTLNRDDSRVEPILVPGQHEYTNPIQAKEKEDTHFIEM